MLRDSFVTRSAVETKKIASRLAGEIAHIRSDRARVIALTGDLGAGKTTFAQGFAHALGVKDIIQSPTFVLMKIYSLKRKKDIKHLVHLDAYRMESVKEAEHLGLKEILKDKDAVILIEWAERIKKILPKDAMWIYFEHGKKANERGIKFT